MFVISEVTAYLAPPSPNERPILSITHPVIPRPRTVSLLGLILRGTAYEQADEGTLARADYTMALELWWDLVNDLGRDNEKVKRWEKNAEFASDRLRELGGDEAGACYILFIPMDSTWICG